MKNKRRKIIDCLKKNYFSSLIYPSLQAKSDEKNYESIICAHEALLPYFNEEIELHELDFFIEESKQKVPECFVDKENYNLSVECVSHGHSKNDFDPIFWFSPIRTDYSIDRLYHYTKLSAENIKDYVIFVNYQKYLPHFIEYAKEMIKQGVYAKLVGPGDVAMYDEGWENAFFNSINLPQMPTYSLIDKNGNGITMINIGVGASNAKTICDHLSVLRPKFCLMVGHCGGLVEYEQIGDYIIGDKYTTLDFENNFSGKIYKGSFCDDLQRCLNKKINIGPIVSVLDRNWELESYKVKDVLKKFKAVGIDMESAKIVEILEKFGIPSASFLCISDKPFHREIRLQKMASEFYENRLRKHLLDALKMMEKFLKINKKKKYSHAPLFR